MASRRSIRPHSAFGAGVLGLLAVGLTSFAPPPTGRGSARPAPAGPIDSVVVRRMDLDTTLLAGGDLMPVKQTTVTCEVEDLDRGPYGGGDAGTLILSIVPNGATVKKGDVLCVLDSSGFRELVRREQIDVETARADHRQVELTLETAKAALREYREGMVPQRTRELESRTALLHSDFERQREYVAWAERMLAKGYFSRAPVLSARQALGRIAQDRSVAEQESRVFRLYTAPREIRQLESQIEGAQATFSYESLRLKAHEERLAQLRKQLENFTIRAPHDGMVVYVPAFEWRGRPLQAGTEVFQHEELVFLPDLSRMEVEVAIHESVGARVRVGMTAEVRIVALPGRRFSGKVVSMELLPRLNYKGWEMKMHFYTRVRLDQTPPGLLPFMSAEVRFDTGRVEDALVIPVEAMAMANGQRCCYVVGQAGLERRAITVRNATPEFLEVTDGLEEGEQVVLHPRPDSPAEIVDRMREGAATR
jgi:HlyD family secretion protein